MNLVDEPMVCLDSGARIEAQICEQVRGCILAGQLQPGEQLSSVRGLAVDLAVNPETVQRAYDRLEAEGLVSTADGSGVRVIGIQAVAWEPGQRQAVLEQFCVDFLARARRLGFTPDEVLFAAAASRNGRLAS